MIPERYEVWQSVVGGLWHIQRKADGAIVATVPTWESALDYVAALPPPGPRHLRLVKNDEVAQ